MELTALEPQTLFTGLTNNIIKDEDREKIETILAEHPNVGKATINKYLKPLGYLQCNYCKSILPLEYYATNHKCSFCKERTKKAKKYGLGQCNICKQWYKLEDLHIQGKIKRCSKCNEIWQRYANGEKLKGEDKKLFNGINRLHKDIPTFKKVYHIYQYNRKKYTTIWGKINKLSLKYGKHIFDRTSAYRVLDLCYIRDKQGKLQKVEKYKHIFRVKQYQALVEEIAKEFIAYYDFKLCADNFAYLLKRTHLLLYCDENEPPQLELYEIALKPIKERIKIHITLLRLLRERELEIEEIIELVKWQHNINPLSKSKVEQFNTATQMYIEDLTLERSNDNGE